MNPEDKLTVFFSMNGILIGSVLIFYCIFLLELIFYCILRSPNKKYYFSGRQIPIDPTVDRFFPTITLWNGLSVEANFGDNPAKPFEYDILKCSGMGLEWI
jgi:hypothetical protein